MFYVTFSFCFIVGTRHSFSPSVGVVFLFQRLGCKLNDLGNFDKAKNSPKSSRLVIYHITKARVW